MTINHVPADLVSQKNVFISYIPASVMRAIKARSINLSELFSGSNKLQELKKLTVRELALVAAASKHQVLSKAIGQTDGYFAFYQSFSDEEQALRNMADKIKDTSDVQTELEQSIGGSAGKNAAISVEHLAPYWIGIVVGEGAIDALQKDNNVLEMLKSIMDIALTYGDMTALSQTQVWPVVERFIAVNAFANPVCRPPSPVYR